MTKTTKRIIGAIIGSIVAWIILLGLMYAISPKTDIVEIVTMSGVTTFILDIIILISLGLQQLTIWIDEPYQIADDSPCKGCKHPNEECCSNF